MRYPTVCVFGGTGFIGSRIVTKLAAQGRRVRVPTRRAEAAKALAVQPGVEVIESDIYDPAALSTLLAPCDAALNLVGVLHGGRGSPYGDGFAQAHVVLPRRIATACAGVGVRRLVHMSSLGADPAGPSMYLRSKGDGEASAHSQPSLEVTVFRPSVVFGPGDHFLNVFARLQRRLPFVPLAAARARFQPVHVDDVAQALVNALEDDATFERTYELGGPRIYTLAELVRFAGLASGHPRPIWALPDGLGRCQAALLECLPGEPMLTRDNLDSMKIDNVLHVPLAPELGVTPRSLEVSGDYLSGDSGSEKLAGYRTYAGR